MTNNVFINNVAAIVKESYAGTTAPRYDWQKSIDMFITNNKHATWGMSAFEIERQRSEFLMFVKNRKFDQNGNEIKETPKLTDEYLVDGKYIKITGDMISDDEDEMSETDEG